MNYIWAGMLLIGIIFSIINNRPDVFTEALMQSCTDAIYFMIGLSGIIAVWCGLMNIAKDSGLIDKIALKAMPAMKFLFPHEKDKDTIAMMLMSFTANVFGAGNSATVFSLKAMERLDKENGGSTDASDAMCMFMAVSMSMIQLVPITIIKIRNDLGSQNPGSIIIPAIVAGLISMAVSIAVCKYYEALERRRKKCR
ncbi:MAG: nucleoside recognition domain-containing protein [Eubacteriales bacterium]|nr:nucleoside recognition domain-containing protein [Eubacteriales bacterium]MDD4390662.1 nucleoside recognition domain-containing protein [Eubacteriales bacterium]